MTIIIILSISILLQIGAAVMALRLIKITRGWGAWVLIATAVSLMAIRRGISLVNIIKNQMQSSSDVSTELVALLISGLVFTGVVMIRPMFEEAIFSGEKIRKTEEKYRELVEQASDGIFIANGEGNYTDVNQAGLDMLGYTRKELLSKTLVDLVNPDELKQTPIQIEHLMAGKTIISERSLLKKDGTFLPVEISAKMLPDGSLQGITRDITERKKAEAHMQMQLERLSALNAIDQVITTSLDINMTVSIILSHLLSQLEVKAADVWVLDGSLSKLERLTVEGPFQGEQAELSYSLEDGLAGRVVTSREMMEVGNFKDIQGKQAEWMHQRGLSYYVGLPLLVKSKVQGVLQIYNDQLLTPDEEWFSFLKTLALQTAIAIENTSLFDNLERTNSELVLAYDATLEGWVRALERRDKETEGHTQRVTDLTLNLASFLNIDRGEMADLRRGALLHDIGKMGIPDSILLKEGPLTDEEWVVMQDHTTMAFELLSPIKYLHSSIDIPYAHHEKWDGTGYPRKLKGDTIPLSARIFALVDVWDALTSDRVYRKAWPVEKVVGFFEEQSGKHFDPQLTSVFLEMVGPS